MINTIKTTIKVVGIFIVTITGSFLVYKIIQLI